MFDVQSETQPDAADRMTKAILTSIRLKSVYVDISKPQFANERLMLYATVGISVLTSDGTIDIFFLVSDAKYLNGLVALLGSLLLV